MLKYRGGRLARHGFIGVVLICLFVAVGLQGQKYITWFTSLPYQALFEEAGGLRSGADVVLSGVKVGTVSEVSLDNGDVRVEFWVDDGIRLGTQSTAQIKTGSLLGRRMLTLDSAGDGVLHPSDVIPRSRTSSPYSLNDALGDLTTNVTTIDTDALNQSLDTLSSTIDQVAPQLGPTFEGLSDLSRSINSRNDSLRDLLSSTGEVTTILAERSDELNSLILNADSLLGVLVDRRQEIVDLLANTSAVAAAVVGSRRRQRGAVGADPGPIELCGSVAREEPGQHRAGAAGSGEGVADPGRSGIQRPLLQRLRRQSHRRPHDSAVHQQGLRDRTGRSVPDPGWTDPGRGSRHRHRHRQGRR